MRIAALVLSLLLSACSRERLIGRSCPEGGCSQDQLTLPPPPGCGTQLVVRDELVQPGTALNRCRLFTLDGLQSGAADGETAYLTRLEIVQTIGHDLELRVAPELDDYDDGEVDCNEIGSRAVPWVPLMTTQAMHDTWSFEQAPLVAARSQRVLVNDAYFNLSERPVHVGVMINLECATDVPASVSQSFEFTTREMKNVQPHTRVPLSASCVFQKDVLVSRLYRRTHLISSFSVRRIDDPEPLWQSGVDWTYDLDPPMPFDADQGLRWECWYENDGDLAFEVGGNSPDACAVLGIYRLPGGGQDDSIERCTR